MVSLSAASVVGLGPDAVAQPPFEFYVGVGSDPAGNDGFIAAFGGGVTITTLETFEDHDPICGLDTLGIDIGLLDAGGVPMSDCAECFVSDIIDDYCADDPGDLLCGCTAINRNPATDASWPQLEFVFEQPTEAFGLWIFDDDTMTQQHFVLHAWDAAGGHAVSPALDNPDSQAFGGWWVEGFLGVRSPSGLTSVVVEQIIDAGPPGNFEVDNIHTVTLACLADFNADGVVNILDFVAFQSAWIDQDPAADCDANAEFNVLDFVCFQLLFQQGCP